MTIDRWTVGWKTSIYFGITSQKDDWKWNTMGTDPKCQRQIWKIERNTCKYRTDESYHTKKNPTSVRTRWITNIQAGTNKSRQLCKWKIKASNKEMQLCNSKNTTLPIKWPQFSQCVYGYRVTGTMQAVWGQCFWGTVQKKKILKVSKIFISFGPTYTLAGIYSQETERRKQVHVQEHSMLFLMV